MKNKGSVSAGLLIILLLIVVAIVAVTATISSDSAQEIKAQYIEGTAVVNGGESYLNLDYNRAIDENYNQLVARGVVNGRYSTIGRGEVDIPDGPDDPPDPPDPPTPTPPVIPPGSDEDYRPYAMQAAIDEINMNVKTHHTIRDTTCNHLPIECYSCTSPGNWHGTLYGITNDWYPCCATGCWLINLAAGNGRGGSQSADGSRVGFTQYSTNGRTYGELPIGTITARSGHEEMIVYNNGTTVYVASFGSCGGIVKCRDQGYSKTKSVTEVVTFTHVWIPN